MTPPTHCPVCWSRHGKALLIGCCVCTGHVKLLFYPPRGASIVCDMIGCQESASGEIQIGDEYIPLCEFHRKEEVGSLTPKWRPLNSK